VIGGFHIAYLAVTKYTSFRENGIGIVFDIQWNIDSHGVKNCSFSELEMYVNLFYPAIGVYCLNRAIF
jgi:hypothetical protein